MKKINLKNFMFLALLISIVFSACKKKDEPAPDPPYLPAYLIETGEATGIRNTEATISGAISKVNNTNITQFGHVWSTSQSPTVDLSSKTAFGTTTSDTSFLSRITGLEKGKTYFVRAYATESEGTFYGAEVSFQTTEQFFKFVVSSVYLNLEGPSSDREWIMIYTSDGQLLETEEIFNGITYEFDWPEKSTADNFMVQLFRASVYDTAFNGTDKYQMQSYLNVSPNTWYLGREPMTEEPIQIGTNTVDLPYGDLDEYYYYDFKNKYTWGFTQPGSNFRVGFHQYFNPDNIWIMYMDQRQAPFYKWFGEVGLNDSYTVASSEITQMKDYVDISFPQANNYLVYIESEDDLQTDIWEYFLVYIDFVNEQSPVRSYYPGDLFNGYYTYLIARSDNVREYMIKLRGTIPDQFVSLPVDIEVINSAVLNFDANISGETDAINPNWSKTEGDGSVSASFTYDVFGAKNDVSSFTAPDLPAEIKALNPSLLDLSNLEYIQTRFYEYDNINGFGDYLIYRYGEPASVSGTFLEYYKKYIYAPGKMKTDIMEMTKKTNRVNHDPFVY